MPGQLGSGRWRCGSWERVTPRELRWRKENASFKNSRVTTSGSYGGPGPLPESLWTRLKTSQPHQSNPWQKRYAGCDFVGVLTANRHRGSEGRLSDPQLKGTPQSRAPCKTLL